MHQYSDDADDADDANVMPVMPNRESEPDLEQTLEMTLPIISEGSEWKLITGNHM